MAKKPIKCFDVVKVVLDETYGEVPGKEEKRDGAIRAALEAMGPQYKDKLMTEGGPDFDDPVTRFAYVFKHVPAHAHWLYDLLCEASGAQKVLESGKARVTCIGGGPGSEIVGILKYLDENKIDCKLFCELVDRCEAWKSTWSDIGYVLDTTSLHTDYVIHDVGDPETWESPSRIAKADIIILSFFVSEVFYLDPEKYLAHMLKQAKKGAFLLVNDNRTHGVYSLMDQVAASCGFKKELADSGVKKIYDWGEDMSVLKKYLQKFDHQSKLTGNMFRRIYEKN